MKRTREQTPFARSRGGDKSLNSSFSLKLSIFSATFMMALRIVLAVYFIDAISCAIISAPTSYTNTMSIFDVSDYDGDFSGDTIDCGEVQNCFISCNEPYGCASMSINASMTTNLILLCKGERSCNQFELMSPGPSDLFNLTCYGTLACLYGQSALTDTEHIHIRCDSNHTATENAYVSCRSLNVDISNASTLNVDCSAGCRSTQFQINKVSNVTMNCMEMYSCYLSSWNMTGSPHITITSPAERGMYRSDLFVYDADSVDILCAEDVDSCFAGESEYWFENAGNVTLSGAGGLSFRTLTVTLSSSNDTSSTQHFRANCVGTESCQDLTVYATDHHSRYADYC